LDIGLWLGKRDGEFHAGADVAWAAFILFDADATFATLAEPVETGGHTIIADRDRLRSAFASTG
jgi:hypothetical protein